MIEFTIPGDAVGKARPRFDSRSRRAYTPQTTVLYEKKIKNILWEQFGKVEPYHGAIRVGLIINQKIPKSDSKKTKLEKLYHLVPCKHKPDIDNVCKIVMDGCNGILYEDDAQVVELVALRQWAEEPSVKVTVEQI